MCTSRKSAFYGLGSAQIIVAVIYLGYVLYMIVRAYVEIGRSYRSGGPSPYGMLFYFTALLYLLGGIYSCIAGKGNPGMAAGAMVLNIMAAISGTTFTCGDLVPRIAAVCPPDDCDIKSARVAHPVALFGANILLLILAIIICIVSCSAVGCGSKKRHGYSPPCACTRSAPLHHQCTEEIQRCIS